MTCDVCGQPARDEELIQINDRWICASCKPLFLQQLTEGTLPPPAFPLPDEFDERILDYFVLVKLSARLVWRDWAPILGLSLLAAVPVNLFLLAIGVFEGESPISVAQQYWATGLLEVLIAVVASLGIAKVVSERMEGRQIGFGGGLEHALRRWLPGIGTGLLGNLIAGFLLLLLIVPGLIWLGYYSFTSPIVSLRGCAGSTALDYSKALVRGRWWAVVGRIFVLGAIVFVIMVPIQVAVALAPPWPSLSFAAAVLGDLCYIPATVGTTVLFLNLDAMQRRSPDRTRIPDIPALRPSISTW